MRHLVWFPCLLLAAACSDSGTHHLADGSIDGPRTDAPSIDAPSIDAPLQPVTLVATLNGNPAPGVKVYFLNADSTVVSNTSTGSDGTASAVMVAGGSVTAIAPQQQVTLVGQGETLDTYVGVKPGDVLHLDVGQGPITIPPTVTFDLVVPTDPNVNALSYELDSSCGQGINITPQVAARRAQGARGRFAAVTNPAVSVTLNCGDTADLMVITRDTDGILLDSLYAPGIGIANGSTITLTNAYAPITPNTVTWTGLGAQATFLNVSKNEAGSNGEFFGASISFDGANTDGSGNLVIPAADGAEDIISAGFQNDGTVFESQQALVWAPNSSTLAFTGAQLLPHYTNTPTFDVPTRAVTWTQSTATRTIDVTEVGTNFSRTTGAGSAAVNNFWQWFVVAPGAEAGNVKYPTLPTDVFDYNAQDGDSAFTFSADTGSVPGGYDLVRPFTFANNFSLQSLATPGATGSAQIAQANLGLLRGPAVAAPTGTSRGLTRMLKPRRTR